MLYRLLSSDDKLLEMIHLDTERVWEYDNETMMYNNNYILYEFFYEMM